MIKLCKKCFFLKNIITQCLRNERSAMPLFQNKYEEINEHVNFHYQTENNGHLTVLPLVVLPLETFLMINIPGDTNTAVTVLSNMVVLIKILWEMHFCDLHLWSRSNKSQQGPWIAIPVCLIAAYITKCDLSVVKVTKKLQRQSVLLWRMFGSIKITTLLCIISVRKSNYPTLNLC